MIKLYKMLGVMCHKSRILGLVSCDQCLQRPIHTIVALLWTMEDGTMSEEIGSQQKIGPKVLVYSLRLDLHVSN